MSTMEYSVNAVWKIKKETILNIKEEEEIKSEIFETALPNISYLISLFNDGSDIVIQFCCFDPAKPDEDSKNEIIEKMDLYVSSANYQADIKTGRVSTRETGGVRYPPHTVYIDRDVLLNPENKYFENDILTLEIRGSLSYKTPTLSLAEILWKKDDKDFAFVVGDKTVKAHKLILREFSSIIAADIISNEITIDNFDCNIVKAVVELCYERKYQYVSKNSGYKMIEFCDIYDMPLIKQQVEHKLSKMITAKNVCEMANKSLELKANALRSFCINVLADCIKNQKPFKGKLADLKHEIESEVLRKSSRHTYSS